MGKLIKGVIGAFIGGMIAGPIGAIFGVIIGVEIGSGDDDSDKRKLEEEEEEEEEDEGQAPMSGRPMRLLFQCLGKLAKADGHVSKDEAAFVRSIMHEWELDAATRRSMRAEFNTGRDASVSFSYLVRELAVELDTERATKRIRCAIVQLFGALMVADRDVHEEEVRMLEETGRALGVEEYVREFLAGYRAQSSSNTNLTLERCYEILGVVPSSTDSQVKSAYRRKAKECHPDLAEGAGLSAADIQRAKQKFQQINIAYQTICEARGA